MRNRSEPLKELVMDEALVKARVAGRQAANELSDLYIQESARLKTEHGLEASITFLELLRDNLIAIRPLQVPAPSPPASKEVKQAPTGGFSASECPYGYVVVEFGEEIEAETERAILLGQRWIPKSQIHEYPEKGDYVESLAVTEWFADKESLV